MKITELNLKNFRQFREKKLSFGDGINIIYGSNERGKSSIVTSLLTAFYTDSGVSAKAFFDHVKTWQTEEKPVINVKFSHKNADYELIKDFQSKKSQLKTKLSALSDNRIIGRKLLEFIGINTIEIFKAVAVIKGNEITNIQDNVKLADQLTQISTGADVNALKALSNIEKAMDEIGRGMVRAVKQPGFLKTNKDTLTIKRDELSKKREIQQIYIKNLQIFHNSEAEVASLTTQLNDKTRLAQNNTLLKSAKEKLGILDQDIKSLNDQIIEIEKYTSQLKNVESDLSETKLTKEIIENANEYITQKQKEIDENSSLLTKKKSELSAINSEDAISKFSKKKFGLTISGVMLLFSVVSYYTGFTPMWFAAGLGVVSFVAIFLLLYFYKPTQSAEHISKVQKNAKGKEIEDKVAEINSKQESLELEKTNKLKELGFENVEDFKTKSQSFQLLENKKTMVMEFIENKLKNSDEEDISELREKLNSKLREKILEKDELKISKIEKLESFEVSGSEFVKLENEIGILTKNLGIQKDLNLSSKVRITDLANDQDGIAQLEEEIAELERLVTFWENRLYSLNIAAENLSSAIRNTAMNAGAKIQKEMKKYLSILTDGRYSEIRVLDDFRIEVFSSEKNEYIDPTGILSTGTIDQIYFIAKIIYLNLIAEDKCPPIIMDDPFVTFDEKRTEKSFEILEEISKNSQIIFFTCHKEYLKYSRNVIMLD